jgi:branched-subunit amino acid ABC-type transport system permease component
MELARLLGLAIGGIPLGAMYALQAMGIVLVYKTSGVFNFAQGAIGMTAAFIAASVGVSYGLPWPIAVVAALAAGAAIGVVMERLTIRPVSGTLPRTVVTLAWLLFLQGLAQLVWGTGAGREFLTILPSTPALRIDALFVSFGWDQLGVLAIAVAIAAALGIFFRTRSFGVAMRAVADDPEGASVLGVDPGRVQLVSWALGAGMAALSGILVTPLLGSLDTVSLVVLTIQALAAALVGRLNSLPLTFAGGIALGMVQPVVQYQFHLAAGGNELVAFVFVLGALLLRKRTGRGDSGGGGLQPVALGPMPSGRAAAIMVAGLVGFGLLQAFVITPDSTSRAIAATFIWAVGILSVVLLSGVAGQVSLCQAAFMGVGGYGAALALGLGVPFLPAILVGGLVAAAAAALVGLPALRLRGLELAIVTLSLAFAADRYFFQAFTPLVGPNRTRAFARPDWLARFTEVASPSGPVQVTDWRPYALIAFVVFVVVAFMVASLRRGRTGAAFTALRSSEAATAAMGFSVIGVKLKGFALSGFAAGIGGALFAGLTDQADSFAFGFDKSIILLAFAVIAGIGSVPGALFGAAIVTLSTLQFGGDSGAVVTDTSAALTTLATAVALMLVLILLPKGLVGSAGGLRERLRRWRRGPGQPPVDGSAELAEPALATTEGGA